MVVVNLLIEPSQKRRRIMLSAEMPFNLTVGILANKFSYMLDWDDVEPLVRLMADLVLAKKHPLQTHADRQEIYRMGEQVEKRILEVLKEDFEDTANYWKLDCERPINLKHERDSLRELAKTAPTATLKRELNSYAWKFQKLLDEGSERLANELLARTDNFLAFAEDLLTAISEANEQDVHRIVEILENAESSLQKIDKTPHIKHVGLPMIAKKRNTSIEAIYTSIKQRLQDIRNLLVPLQLEVERNKQREEQDAKSRAEQQQRELESVRRAYQEQQRERTLEEVAQSIEARNAKAGKAARQFIEHAKLGNAGGMWKCLTDIHRIDGGKPVEFQQEYQRIASQSQ